MPLSQNQKTQIDIVIAELLEAFHTIPEEEALCALDILRTTPMMNEKAEKYPDIQALLKAVLKAKHAQAPSEDKEENDLKMLECEELEPILALFSDENSLICLERILALFSDKNSLIYEAFERLHKMMSNRHPHKPLLNPVGGRERENEVNYGFFNLQPELKKNTDLSAEVHDYLKEQFDLRKQLVKTAPHIVKNLLEGWKKSSKAHLYDKALFYWMDSPIGEEHPEKKMKKIISTALEGLELFLKSEEAMNETLGFSKDLNAEQRNALLNTFINSLLSSGPEFLDETRATTFRTFLAEIQGYKGHDQIYIDAAKKLKTLIGQFGFQVDAVLPSFILMSQAQQLIQKYRLLLQSQGDTEFQIIEAICDRYKTDLLNGAPETLSELSDEDTAQLRAFIDKTRPYIQDIHYDELENAFATYFACSMEEQKNIYARLVHYAFIENKVFLTDAQLDAYMAHGAAPEGDSTVYYFRPYETNRILLTALMTSPTTWSPLFAHVFNSVINMLDNLQDHSAHANAAHNQNLKVSSYPKSLVIQLRFLHTQYLTAHHAVGADVEEKVAEEKDQEPKPEFIFPSLYFPESRYAKEWSKLLFDLPQTTRAHILKEVVENRRNPIQSAKDFYPLLDFLSAEQSQEIVDAIPEEQYPSLIQSYHDLFVIFKILPEHQHQTVLAAIPKEKWLNLVSSILIFCKILQNLPEQSRQAMITAIPEVEWLNLVPTIYDLRDMLFMNLPEQSHQVMLTAIPKEHWLSLIQTSSDLEYLLEYLPEQGHKAILATIPDAKLLSLIKKGLDLYKLCVVLPTQRYATVLAAIPKEQWASLTQTITMSNWWDELLKTLQNLPEESCQAILTAIPKECLSKLIQFGPRLNNLIKTFSVQISQTMLAAVPEEKWWTLFGTRFDLYSLLKNFSEQQCQAALIAIPEDLWPTLIQKVSHLDELLQNLPENSCEAVLAAIPKEQLSALIQSAHDDARDRLFNTFPYLREKIVLASVKPAIPNPGKIGGLFAHIANAANREQKFESDDDSDKEYSEWAAGSDSDEGYLRTGDCDYDEDSYPSIN